MVQGLTIAEKKERQRELTLRVVETINRKSPTFLAVIFQTYILLNTVKKVSDCPVLYDTNQTLSGGE
jgi:hypothetical protein